LIIENILKKNKFLKNIYLNEECYIFGNGSSIKKYDLKKFRGKNIFSCGWLFLHKDYQHLNILADFEMHPGIFLPIWKNEYNNKFEFNKINQIFKSKNRLNKANYFFTSLTNLPGLLRYDNIYYLYHFGKKKLDFGFTDPSKEFSLMENSLYAMVGIASFMGFKNIYLVGMDYLLDKPIYGHFYENFQKEKKQSDEVRLRNINFFEYFKTKNNFKLIVPNNKHKSFLDTIEYKDYFNSNYLDNSNHDIILEKDLDLLNRTNLRYKIFD
jgi:hypothetical protein